MIDNGFSNARGVAFLDPFGMDVDWTTLEAISQTQVFDVWYLFSLSGLYRQATRNPLHIDDTKRQAITRVLGTEEWLNEIYREPPQLTFFESGRLERADVDSLEVYVHRRLSQIFAKVAKPLRLPKAGAPRFSLFFAVSNPDPKAIRLAMSIASHILERA